MSKETWLPVVGYEGLYLVSSMGRVMSQRRGKIMAMSIRGGSSRGYLYVTLSKGNKGKKEYVHRLVAMAFHPKDHANLEVNHKDGDKLNNTANNLEWVTRQENISHAVGLGLSPPTRSVLRKCTCGTFTRFDSLYQAAKANFKSTDVRRQAGHIHRAAANGTMCGGYYWEFEDGQI